MLTKIILQFIVIILCGFAIHVGAEVVLDKKLTKSEKLTFAIPLYVTSFAINMYCTYWIWNY